MAGDKNVTAARAAGYAIMVGPDCGTIEADTIQCGHCGQHWVIQRGSGRKRGFCTVCGKPTCGPGCPIQGVCITQEELVTNIEKGRPLDFKQIVISTAGLDLPAQ